MTPELTKMVDGVTDTRVFLPENGLILLGGGHKAVPLCAMASKLDFAVTVLDKHSHLDPSRQIGFGGDDDILQPAEQTASGIGSCGGFLMQ